MTEDNTRNMETPSSENQTSTNHLTIRERIGEALLNNKIAILGTIIIVFSVNNLILFFPSFTDSAIWGIPFALLAIWVISWLKGVGWSELGLFRPESWSRVILVGVLTAIVLQSAALLQIKLGGPIPDLSSFDQIKSNPWALLGYLMIAWTTAGFGEEIIWRGFILKQISRLFGEGKTGWMIGLVGSALLFGLIHSYQGITGIIMTGFTGIVYGLIFLNSKRNLWTSIFAHAFTDSLAFILIYNWDTVSRILDI